MSCSSRRPTVPTKRVRAAASVHADAVLAHAVVPPPADDDRARGELQSETRIATRTPIGSTADDVWARAIVGRPVVRLSIDQIKRLKVDHRTGFLLSLMDGGIDLESIVDVCGMPHDHALRVVRDLFESGVIEFR